MEIPAPISVRLSTAADGDAIREAIAQEQEFERTLHDTRKPGVEVAQPYYEYLRERAARQRGAIFVAEVGGVFAGYAACWITANDALAETDDSNICGYVSDICVLTPFRGRGIAAGLLGAAQKHAASLGVRRIRIISLAANTSARRAYVKSGFEPYEIIFEKRL